MEEKKTYQNMTNAELKTAATQIIKTSSSEDEIKQRLVSELNYPYSIAITSQVPSNKTGLQARNLASLLGGLTMRNGAMVMVMMHGKNQETLSL